MKKRKWIEISIEVPPSFQDLLIGQLALLGFQGFLQEGELLLCYAPVAGWTDAMKAKFATVLHRFASEFKNLKLRWQARAIQEKNWNETWEKSVNIVDATSNIIVKPSWKKLRVRDKGKIVIHIDPKMAFGTGHHETTRLALTLVEELVRKGDTVLDVGCGTGILAIASVKLGARSALAIDNDPQAISNATENIRRNRASRQVKPVLGTATRLPKRSFDLIIANIDLPTIGKSLRTMVKRMKSRGFLIVSGILVSDLSAFMDLISHQGIVPLEIVSENECVAIALVNAHALDDD